MFFKWCERCGHHKDDHGTPDRHCVWMLCACQRLSGGPFGFEVKEKPEPEEPPLTPEEEEMVSGYEELAEQAAKPPPMDPVHILGAEAPPGAAEGPEYTPCVCGHIEPEHEVDGYCYDEKCGCVGYRTKPDFEVPSQPDRRPPYLLAYSVQGHLYEVALPGDATVAALDGRLVITHHLGPVAGICQIAPITSEESA